MSPESRFDLLFVSENNEKWKTIDLTFTFDLFMFHLTMLPTFMFLKHQIIFNFIV